MSEGSLQQSGLPLEVYKSPANRFVAGFIGSPAMNFIDATLIKVADDYYIDAESFKLKVPKAFESGIEGYVGKSVIFGVRPEDFYDGHLASNTTPFTTIKARVEVIEPLGAEINIYLVCGQHSLVAKMDTPSYALHVDQTMEVVINMEKTHIFDSATLVAVV